jgi:hypothetical protein
LRSQSTTRNNDFKMRKYHEIEPKLAKTIENTNAPNKLSGSVNPQPDY